MKRSLSLYILCGFLLVVSAGCANPASDAPQAEVRDAAPEPAAMAEPAAMVYPLEGTIGFVGSKVTGSHDGGFEEFDGTVSVTDGTPEGSSIEVMIDTTSLWADDDRLTGHLKSPDFFDVEKYPTASFRSSSIVANDDDTYTITGNLDLHGVVKEISFPAEIEMDDDGFEADAEFSIKRFDWNIVYPGKTDDLIRDEVLIKLDLASEGDMDMDSDSATDEMAETEAAT